MKRKPPGNGGEETSHGRSVAFPITGRWPAKHPDRLQLYSVKTPDGVKASIMLEETGLPYEPHLHGHPREPEADP